MEDADDRLSQLCQAQIFFALLSSIALKYDADTRRNSTNITVLLTVLTILPMALAFIFETPVFDLVTSREKRAAALEKLAPLQRRTSRLASILQRSRSSLRSKSKLFKSATSSEELAAAAFAAKLEKLATPSASTEVDGVPSALVAPEDIELSAGQELEAALPADFMPAPVGASGTADAQAPATADPAEDNLLVATFGDGPLGISLANRHGGVRVTEVDAGSQAEAQGVRVGAFVKAVYGQSTDGLDDSGVVKLAQKVGRPLLMTFSLAHPAEACGAHATRSPPAVRSAGSSTAKPQIAVEPSAFAAAGGARAALGRAQASKCAKSAANRPAVGASPAANEGAQRGAQQAQKESVLPAWPCLTPTASASRADPAPSGPTRPNVLHVLPAFYRDHAPPEDHPTGPELSAVSRLPDSPSQPPLSKKPSFKKKRVWNDGSGTSPSTSASHPSSRASGKWPAHRAAAEPAAGLAGPAAGSAGPSAGPAGPSVAAAEDFEALHEEKRIELEVEAELKAMRRGQAAGKRLVVRRGQTTKEFMDDAKRAEQGGLGV